MENLETFGDFLRGLRQARCLTLGQLSLQSGLGKATLSRWEAGTTFPRIPELTRAMDALHAAPAHRTHGLHLLHAPRAIAAVRNPDTKDSASEIYLSLGDALFGLRQRVGKTQAEVARCVGISRGLYGHWETDGGQPDTAQLHAVGFALGASDTEVTALSSRVLSHTPMQKNRDALLHQCQIMSVWTEGVTEGVHRLHALSSLANMGYLVRKKQAHLGDLALVISTAGEVASTWGDNDQRDFYFSRAIALAHAAPASESLHFHLIQAVSHQMTYAAKNVSPSTHAARALAWLPRFPTPEGKAFLLRLVAKFLAPVNPSEALRLGDIYCQLVADNPDEYPCRLHDRGNLLRLCGRPAESVQFLASLTPPDAFRAGLYQVHMAHGLINMGAWNEARTCLDTGRRIFAEANLEIAQSEAFHREIFGPMERALP